MQKIRPANSVIVGTTLALCALILITAVVAESLISQKQILFEVWSGNPWPGSTSHGIYVDADGRVFSFEVIDTSVNRLITHIGDPPYSTVDLYRKYGFTGKEVGKVDKTILGDLLPLIQSSQSGVQGDPELSGCHDFGLVVFTAFLYDAEARMHIPVTLYVAGDVAERNTTHESEVLFQWLEAQAKEYGHAFDDLIEHCAPE